MFQITQYFMIGTQAFRELELETAYCDVSNNLILLPLVSDTSLTFHCRGRESM